MYDRHQRSDRSVQGASKTVENRSWHGQCRLCDCVWQWGKTERMGGGGGVLKSRVCWSVSVADPGYQKGVGIRGLPYRPKMHRPKVPMDRSSDRLEARSRVSFMVRVWVRVRVSNARIQTFSKFWSIGLGLMALRSVRPLVYWAFGKLGFGLSDFWSLGL